EAVRVLLDEAVADVRARHELLPADPIEEIARRNVDVRLDQMGHRARLRRGREYVVEPRLRVAHARRRGDRAGDQRQQRPTPPTAVHAPAYSNDHAICVMRTPRGLELARA